MRPARYFSIIQLSNSRGLASGILYFLILLCISAVIHPGEALISGERITVFLLCAAGGMLGGMFG